MPKKAKRTGNVGKPLKAGVARGLLRAMMTIAPPPNRRVARLVTSAASPELQRFHSPEQIADLASRILQRAEAGKVVRLSPTTAALVAKALVAMNAVPSNEAILEIVCGSKACGFRKDNHRRFCFGCHGKANKIMALLRGERALDAS